MLRLFLFTRKGANPPRMAHQAHVMEMSNEGLFARVICILVQVQGLPVDEPMLLPCVVTDIIITNQIIA